MLKKVINKVSGIEDTVVDSFNIVDISDLKGPIVSMFHNTLDYGDKYVARIFDFEKPTNIIILRDSIEEIEADVKKSFGISFFVGRHEDDVKSLIGSWFI